MHSPQLLSWLLLPFARVAGLPPVRDVQTVYRGDTRSPAIIEGQNGFLPAINPPPEDRYGLNEHLRFGKKPYGAFASAYISTSTQMMAALKYGNFQAKQTAKHTYLYRIQATPNMIDAAPSLQGPISDLAKAAEEYDALGGIRWDQVIGWNTVPAHVSQSALQEYANNPNKDFTANPKYDSKYNSRRASGPQPQLADGATAYERAVDFMSQPEVGDIVGWSSDTGFPLFTAPNHAEILASAAVAAQELGEEAHEIDEAVAEVGRALDAVKTEQDPVKMRQEAAKAGDAAKRAKTSAKKVAHTCDQHVCLHSEPFNKAFGMLKTIRAAASKAINLAYIKTATSHRKAAQEASKTGDADRAKSAANEVSRVKQEAAAELFAKIQAKEPVSDTVQVLQHYYETLFQAQKPLVEMEMDRNIIDAAGIVWSRTRSYSLNAAAEEEESMLTEEIAHMRQTVEAISGEVDTANEASDRAQKRKGSSKAKDAIRDQSAETGDEIKERVIADVKKLEAEAKGTFLEPVLKTTVAIFLSVGGAGFLAAAAMDNAGAGATAAGLGLAFGVDTKALLSTLDSISVASEEVEAYIEHAIAEEASKSVADLPVCVAKAAATAVRHRSGIQADKIAGRDLAAVMVTKRALLEPFVARAVRAGLERAMARAGERMELPQAIEGRLSAGRTSTVLAWASPFENRILHGLNRASRILYQKLRWMSA